MQTLGSLAGDESAPVSGVVFEQIGEPGSFLWRANKGSRGEVRDFMNADGVVALFGAIDVLGHLDEIRVDERRPLTSDL